MPKDYRKNPDYVPLDAPYAKLNAFIMAEQAAGKLTQLAPWNESHTLRDGIRAMHKHRLGARSIGNYYLNNSQTMNDREAKLQIELWLKKASISKIKNILEFAVTSALWAWEDTADRKRFIQEDKVYIPLNELIKELEFKALIHSLPDELIANNIIMGQTPLTLRQALTVLNENIGGCRKIASHIIDHKDHLGISLSEKEIEEIEERLNNFINLATKSMRAEDLDILIAGYKSLADNDESRFGISKPDTGTRVRLPLLRRVHADVAVSHCQSLELNKSEYDISMTSLMKNLSPREQVVIQLYLAEGLTMEDIGREIKLTGTWAGKIGHKGLIKMVAKLEKCHWQALWEMKPRPLTEELLKRLYNGMQNRKYQLPLHGQAKGSVSHLTA